MVTEDPNVSVGLPEGLAEKLVRHTFYKWKQKPEVVYSNKDIPVVEETIIETTDDNVATVSEHLEKNIDNALEPSKKFTKSESYNGGIFDHYCWSQTITDVDITVKVPENFRKKNICVEILPSNISVKLLGGATLLEGELCQKCKSNDAIWSLDKEKLQIHLEKCQEIWWNCLIKTEPQIDISKIDCSRPYDELSDEAQAKIEELQWNQERKRLGLPTSNELAMHDTLKKAWDAEGSPFKGHQFDPSLVSFN